VGVGGAGILELPAHQLCTLSWPFATSGFGECVPTGVIEVERLGERPHRVRMRPSPLPALQRPDCPGGQARSFGELLLSEGRRLAQTTELNAESVPIVGRPREKPGREWYLSLVEAGSLPQELVHDNGSLDSLELGRAELFEAVTSS
jgi:hypothetical protein